MNINPNSQINFTYQPLKAVKKPSLFSKIVEPIRASLGASVWKSLGKLHLSQEAKNTIESKRDDFRLIAQMSTSSSESVRMI